jgi:hypothetical protein
MVKGKKQTLTKGSSLDFEAQLCARIFRLFSRYTETYHQKAIKLNMVVLSEACSEIL